MPCNQSYTSCVRSAQQLSTERIRGRKGGSGDELDCVGGGFGRFVVLEQVSCAEHPERLERPVGSQRFPASDSYLAG
jgi:hypothetical protein